jgi:hypothetical protein
VGDLQTFIFKQIEKGVTKTLDASKRREFGERVAEVYQLAEQERFYKGFNAKGRKMSYNYAKNYKEEKGLFVKRKGSLYQQRGFDVIDQFKARKVNDYGRLTGQLNSAIKVEAVAVTAPLLRKSATIQLRMYIDEFSDAIEYAEYVNDDIKFFGFMYDKIRLPMKYERRLNRIKAKFL